MVVSNGSVSQKNNRFEALTKNHPTIAEFTEGKSE